MRAYLWTCAILFGLDILIKVSLLAAPGEPQARRKIAIAMDAVLSIGLVLWSVALLA